MKKILVIKMKDFFEYLFSFIYGLLYLVFAFVAILLVIPFIIITCAGGLIIVGLYTILKKLIKPNK